MSANIFLHELRAHLRSVLTWSLSLLALTFFFMGIFTSFASQAELMNTMLAKFPPQLLAAFGMNGMDLSTVLGYYSFLYLFIQICHSIQAGNFGFGLVSIEESELTADFLLSRPVSRARILTSKLLAAALSLLLTDLVVVIGSLVALNLFRDGRPFELGTLFLLFLALPIFQAFFLALGLVISLLVKRVRNVTPYALGLGFGMYLLNAFSGLQGKVIFLEYLTPYKHFDANFIVQNTALDTPLVLLNGLVTVLALAASYWLYLRRDIPAVV